MRTTASVDVAVIGAASIEHHVDWITDCIGDMRAHGLERIEATPEARAGWTEEVRKVADETLYPRANSWYMGANVPCKPRVFLADVGGLDVYTARCSQVADQDYSGFKFTPAAKGAASLQAVGEQAR